MSEHFIQGLFADRIGGARYGTEEKVYKFERIKRAKAAAQSDKPHVPLIDMGVGEPDAMAAPGVVQELARRAAMPENRFYADNGIEAFRTAAAEYMARVFGVEGLDPQREVVHAIGSKSAFAILPQAFINPGDVTITTVPGYPVLATHTRYLGGEVYPLPLHKANGFLPDLDAVPDDVWRRAKLLYLNYPNNPTGASATAGFFERVVELAQRHQVVVVHDAAYAALTFGDEAPLSFLSVPGAREVGIEVQSLSKAFNMTGWRLGWVCGHERVVKAFADIKDNTDSGQFRAVQWAGVHALNHPQITIQTAVKYARRHALLAECLRACGFDAQPPAASFYLYVEAPTGTHDGRRFESAEDFSQYLIREKLISTVPWDDAGRFVRFSVTFDAGDEDEERRVIDEIRRRLSETRFIW